MGGKAIFTVGAVIIKDKKVLLVKHTKKAKHLEGTFGLPAVEVRPDEKVITALIREVKEETGLEVQSKDVKRLPQPYCDEMEQKDGKKLFIYLPYIVKKYSGNITRGDTNEPFWIDISKLETLNLLPNVKKIIEEALAPSNIYDRILHIMKYRITLARGYWIPLLVLALSSIILVVGFLLQQIERDFLGGDFFEALGFLTTIWVGRPLLIIGLFSFVCFIRVKKPNKGTRGSER